MYLRALADLAEDLSTYKASYRNAEVLNPKDLLRSLTQPHLYDPTAFATTTTPDPGVNEHNPYTYSGHKETVQEKQHREHRARLLALRLKQHEDVLQIKEGRDGPGQASNQPPSTISFSSSSSSSPPEVKQIQSQTNKQAPESIVETLSQASGSVNGAVSSSASAAAPVPVPADQVSKVSEASSTSSKRQAAISSQYGYVRPSSGSKDSSTLALEQKQQKLQKELADMVRKLSRDPTLFAERKKLNEAGIKASRNSVTHQWLGNHCKRQAESLPEDIGTVCMYLCLNPSIVIFFPSRLTYILLYSLVSNLSGLQF